VTTGASSSGPRMIKAILIRLLVVTGVLLVNVGLGELLVRVMKPQATMFPRYVTSPDYAYEFPPNATIRNARGNLWSFTYTTNEIGRRGPFVQPAARYEIPNLVLLGDSVTFGIGVDDGDVYSAQLQKLVGNAWRVINGGMAGWGIDSEIKWFFQTGARYQPRAVVLQFSRTDPWDSNTGVTSVVEGAFEFHVVPASSRKPSWMDWVARAGVLQRSHLYSLLRSFETPGGAGDFNARALRERADAGTAPAEPPRRAHQEVQYLEYLQTFAESLSDDGIRFLLLSGTHDEKSGYASDIAAFPRVEAGVRSLEKQGLLRFVELPLNEMQKYMASPEGHPWGPEHHRIVAEALAAALRDPR
jgi:hypothetical protein